MNPDTTVYIPVPVSEKPDKEGDYFVIVESDKGIECFRTWLQFYDGKWHHDKWEPNLRIREWLKPTTISEITTSQPGKSNEDILVSELSKKISPEHQKQLDYSISLELQLGILVKALEEVQHHLDTWADEPSRAIRLVGNLVTKTLESYRTSVKGE